ncbi:Cytochrome P450 [Mycena kentingensis (nom. inval.)]|nr:Cytochrome P450 [Mycena kentingensis (nom. inval.)]
MHQALVLLSLLAAAFVYLRFYPSKRATLPLPPGPKVDWLGRVPGLPRVRPWKTYAQWSERYGDLIYINMLGNPILVLNSATAAADLLERRGSLYSSRPLFPYGSRWQTHRAMFHRHLPTTESSVKYHPLQLEEARALCRRLLDSPREFRYHIRKTAAAITVRMTYGECVNTDEYIVLADRALASLAQAGIFGTYLVDYVPILKYAPSWLPFQRKAREWRKPTRAMLNLPFAAVKQHLNDGCATKCVVTEELERIGAADPAAESTVANVSATLFAGGADTVASALASFFLVMSLYPEVQRRGQEAIDGAIGQEHRLPLFTDRPQLEFIDYICFELLRWGPVTPLGIAHYTTAQDQYKNFTIPKNTTVLPNVWAILHNPVMYPDPEVFNPDRFAPHNTINGKNQLPDPAFGFGRRICPGRHFAFDTLWICISTLLTLYTITKDVDEHGNDIEPTTEFTPHLLSHPLPFGCTITPRSSGARQLIELEAGGM